jgi:hypothetical protein
LIDGGGTLFCRSRKDLDFPPFGKETINFLLETRLACDLIRLLHSFGEPLTGTDVCQMQPIDELLVRFSNGSW